MSDEMKPQDQPEVPAASAETPATEPAKPEEVAKPEGAAKPDEAAKPPETGKPARAPEGARQGRPGGGRGDGRGGGNGRGRTGRDGGGGGRGGPGGGPGGPRRGGKRQFFRKRKVCKFCVERIDLIDYKNADMLKPFVQERGKLLPRRITGTCSRHQRWLGEAIKRARNIALLPFSTMY